jgi:transposase-like protein
LNKEVKRRANVVGIFPNEASIRRLIGAILAEQNDEWALQNRYLTLESLTDPSSENAAADLALPNAA